MTNLLHDRERIRTRVALQHISVRVKGGGQQRILHHELQSRPSHSRGAHAHRSVVQLMQAPLAQQPERIEQVLSRLTTCSALQPDQSVHTLLPTMQLRVYDPQTARGARSRDALAPLSLCPLQAPQQHYFNSAAQHGRPHPCVRACCCCVDVHKGGGHPPQREEPLQQRAQVLGAEVLAARQASYGVAVARAWRCRQHL